MSHVHQGPLATYNSLTDGHLSAYFSNGRMRRHLRKAGLVTKRGEVVSEATYRLNMSRKEHKKQVKDMLAQAIVHKTLDLERTRQAEIKKKLEEISKIQLVRKVRAATGRKGDEDLLPYLTPRSQRPESSPAFKSKGQTTQKKFRPNSAPGVRTESRQSQLSLEEEGDVLYLDDDGRPITPANLEHRVTGEQAHIDTRHLHTLDTAAIRKYAMLMSQMEEGRGVTSPYMISQVPLPPKTPLSGRALYSSRRVQSASASPKRPVTTDSRIARLHRPETAKAHPGDQQTMCRVLMKYHGWALNLAREKMDPTQEVIVEQQHCGGNTLTVFKERLSPGSTFKFISYRHRGYPFSLTLYLDGQMDSRVSTCCEFRHSRGAKIGGKQGHFSLLGVDGAVPCYKCQVAKGVLVRNKATPRKSKRPSERHMEEVIVVATKKDDDDYDDDNYTDRSRTGKSRPGRDEKGTVVVAVEKDDDDSQSPMKKDTTYDDDDFEDSRSSASSRSSSRSRSSESDSETESSARKDEAVKQPKQTRERFRSFEARGNEREELSPVPPVAKDAKKEKEGTGESRSVVPRLDVKGTDREIDDYSSDEDHEDKGNAISMENVEADNAASTHHRHSRGSLTSSPSSSESNNEDDVPQEEGERGRDNTIIRVDLVDREERKENTRKEKERKEEERKREEEEMFELLRRKKEGKIEAERKAEEARRREDAYQQQLRDEEERRKKEKKMREEEQKKKEEEEKRLHKIQEEEEEERRQSVVDVHDTEVEYHKETDIARKDEVDAREEHVKEVEKGYYEEEDDDERYRQEPLSSTRSDSSTVRSSTPPTPPSSYSTDDKPERQLSKEATTQEDERESVKSEEDRESVRSASPSPVPTAADETHLGPKQTTHDDTIPPRATSPFPPAAVYIHRRDTRTENEMPSPPPESESESPTQSRPLSPKPLRSDAMQSEEPSLIPPRATSPFPSAAVYQDRPKPQTKVSQPAEEDVDTDRSDATVTIHRTEEDSDMVESNAAVTIQTAEDPDTRATSPFPSAAVYQDRPKRQTKVSQPAEEEVDTDRSDATVTIHRAEEDSETARSNATVTIRTAEEDPDTTRSNATDTSRSAASSVHSRSYSSDTFEDEEKDKPARSRE